jgi:uncharacterized membrane protein
MFEWHQVICSVFFIFAGIMHFAKPKFFLAIMPPYLPFHKEAVWISGIAEILFGYNILLPDLQSASAWGLILLLVAVFPANIYMATADKFQKLSPIIRWGRLPMQALLIWWVSLYIK